ncbi:MAG: polymerase sigma factor, partial [Conexibacter sp.]|nr:polymerase sigma factor [Conexibacter sp.]
RRHRSSAKITVVVMDVGDLYDAHARHLLVFFARRTYDSQLAMDLVAETFARAYEHRDRHRGSSQDEAVGWLWGIARNVLHETHRRGHAERRALRRLGVQSEVLTDGELARVDDLAGLEDLRGLVAGALRELSSEQREVVELRVVGELDYPQIARRLGISEQTARARLSRGLRALGAALDAAEGTA